MANPAHGSSDIDFLRSIEDTGVGRMKLNNKYIKLLRSMNIINLDGTKHKNMDDCLCWNQIYQQKKNQCDWWFGGVCDAQHSRLCIFVALPPQYSTILIFPFIFFHARWLAQLE